MNLRDNKGFTLLEMVFTMLIIGILGIFVMKMIISSNTFYKKVYTDYDARSEARLAIDYISSVIRKNDSIGAIKVENNKILIAKDQGKETKEVDTIGYNSSEKKLYYNEGAISKRKKIAEISSFEAKLDGSAIVMTIGYIDSSKTEKKYTETLVLRSYN